MNVKERADFCVFLSTAQWFLRRPVPMNRRFMRRSVIFALRVWNDRVAGMCHCCACSPAPGCSAGRDACRTGEPGPADAPEDPRRSARGTRGPTRPGARSGRDGDQAAGRLDLGLNVQRDRRHFVAKAVLGGVEFRQRRPRAQTSGRAMSRPRFSKIARQPQRLNSASLPEMSVRSPARSSRQPSWSSGSMGSSNRQASSSSRARPA